MQIKCSECGVIGDFNDDIDQDTMFHVYGFMVWGYNEENTILATCHDCLTKKRGEKKEEDRKELDLLKMPSFRETVICGDNGDFFAVE